MKTATTKPPHHSQALRRQLSRFSWRGAPRLLAAFLGAWLALGFLVTAHAGLSISFPRPRQIVQRNADNLGRFTVTGLAGSLTNFARIEARMLVMPGSTNNGVSTDWVVIVDAATNGAFTGTIANIAAGGWYQIEVRAVDAETNELATAVVTRLGVGDIFVTAGQSNAGCFGSPQQTPTDDRVSSYYVAPKAWQFARDGQPDNSGGMGTGGSPWPVLGSILVASNQVPVGFVCLAVGGSALASWLPGTTSFQNISNVMRLFGTNGVRAVLWHQGETDAASGTTAASYAMMLSNVIVSSRAIAGWSVPWGIAEVGYNAGNALAAQEAVMAGQRQCIYTVPDCFRGPRTDDFHLEGKLSDTVHFNATGLAEHGRMWADALLGIETLAVKNGNFESNTALLDGRTELLSQVIGWNRLNAAGTNLTAAAGGYLNPTASTYSGTADTINGGVLTNMDGRHVATLYGTVAGLPGGDAFLQTLAAHLQPSTIYTLQAAVGVRNGNIHGGYQLDFLTNGVAFGTGITGNVATLNVLAGGSATNQFTVVSCTVTSAAVVAPNQQLAIRIGKPIGGGTYLDFDDVRLTTQLTEYGQWQMTNWQSLTATNSWPGADPDGDGLPNLVEFHLLSANPNAPTTMPQPQLLQLAGEDYLQMQILKNPAPASGSIGFQVSYDLSNWFAPTNSGNGDFVVEDAASQCIVRLRRNLSPAVFFRLVASL